MATRDRISERMKKNFKKSMQNVIKGLSRKIVVYKQPAKSECPNCYFDKLTNRSTNKCKWTAVQARDRQLEWAAAGNTSTRYKYFVKGRCPVCSGRGYLETLRKKAVDCLVTWDASTRGGGNALVTTPAGTEGSTVIELKTDPKYYDLFRNSDHLVIDGVECKVSRTPILRGLGNNTVLVITAFTTEKPEIDKNEILKEYR